MNKNKEQQKNIISINGCKNVIDVQGNQQSLFRYDDPIFRKVDSNEVQIIKHGFLVATRFDTFDSDNDFFQKNYNSAFSMFHCCFSSLNPKALDKQITKNGKPSFFEFKGSKIEDLLNMEECACFFDSNNKQLFCLPYVGRTPNTDPSIPDLWIDASIRYVKYENSNHLQGKERDFGHIQIDESFINNRSMLGRQRKSQYTRQCEITLIIFITSTKEINIPEPYYALLPISKSGCFHQC
jgi:hypothetical protein